MLPIRGQVTWSSDYIIYTIMLVYNYCAGLW